MGRRRRAGRARSLACGTPARDDDYSCPSSETCGASRRKLANASRILSDDELRRVWKAAEAEGDVYGAFVRLSLLCGQRREKVATMKWDDLVGDVWTVPSGAREKGVPGALQLPPLAMEIIRAQPRFDGSSLRLHQPRQRRALRLLGTAPRLQDALWCRRLSLARFAPHGALADGQGRRADRDAERVLGHARAPSRRPTTFTITPPRRPTRSPSWRAYRTIVRGEPGDNVVVMQHRRCGHERARCRQ